MHQDELMVNDRDALRNRRGACKRWNEEVNGKSLAIITIAEKLPLDLHI